MNNIIRAFVVVLALTGAVATTQTSSASSKTAITTSKLSAMPTPMCPLNSPNACNIDGGW